MCESKLQITESRVEFPEYQVINIQRNIDMKKLLTRVSLPKSVKSTAKLFFTKSLLLQCCSYVLQ